MKTISAQNVNPFASHVTNLPRKSGEQWRQSLIPHEAAGVPRPYETTHPP